MALVTWDESYSVNVKSCDAQHQKLFSLINSLHEAMKLGRGRQVVGRIVDELERYTQTHFSAEEALMERAQYCGLEEHCTQHRHFESRVAQFKKDLDEGAAGDSISVLTFLKDWLATHILRTDRMYSEELNAHGIN